MDQRRLLVKLSVSKVLFLSTEDKTRYYCSDVKLSTLINMFHVFLLETVQCGCGYNLYFMLVSCYWASKHDFKHL